ncbi:uncharacterized protein BX664DRAFT_331295 [Halteromyces radiatus]|uniref:uncharacterized protein n=1 Tax=Halteromyces radiatus TaxID=101107 RepID=UPI00222003D3|nr:uncharacterized protein BX664DRAFT_331295 [Halteromyces radiatus]KAI8088756.1 hypothetical protein BX664DRAFT_331295 [Halteromyces radiatus]
MNPSEFPPLNLQDNTTFKNDNISMESSLDQVDQRSPSQNSSLKPSYADTAGQEVHLLENNPTPAEQIKGKLLDHQIPEYTPPNPSRSYADVSSHEGFPTLEESVERQTPQENDLSDLPSITELQEQPSARRIPPPPPSASFAKMASKPAPSPPPSPPFVQPPSIYDSTTFPSLESSTKQTRLGSDTLASLQSISNQSTQVVDATKQSVPFTQSYVDAVSQDLDQAPPSAQSRIHLQPVFNEHDMMTESTRRETRKLKQLQNSGNTKDLTPEMEKLEKLLRENQQDIGITEEQAIKKSPEKAQQTKKENIIQRKENRQYPNKFTIFNTLSTLHSNGYSWLTSLFTAMLLHIRYSPFTSPYRFPFIYRSLTDLVTLPIYTKYVRTTHIPLLQQSKQQLDESISEYGCTRNNIIGLRLYDGLRVIKHLEEHEKLQWWQVGIWATHRVHWMLSFMALQDATTQLVPSSTLLALKDVENENNE